MNKIKFGFLSLLLTVAFASCNKNDYQYTPGAVNGQYNIGFTDEQNRTLALTDDTIMVTLTRTDATEEVTVPITKVTVPSFVTVPESATFAAGETSTSIVLNIGDDMLPFTSYKIALSIPESYTTPYSENAPAAVYNCTIQKEDYAVVANGTFVETVLWGTSWEQTLEYSEYLDLYRLPSLIAEGTDYYFYFNGKSGEDQVFYFTNASGEHQTSFATGFEHKTYGMISTTILEEYGLGYDEENNEFYWPWRVTVSAGSFGADYQYYDVTEWIKKPWENK